MVIIVSQSVFLLVASPACAARGLSQVADGLPPTPSTDEVSKAKDTLVTRSVIVRLKTEDGVIESNVTSLAGVCHERGDFEQEGGHP